MNMENFITGFPGHEHEHRAAMLEVLGQEKYDFFFDKVSIIFKTFFRISYADLLVSGLFLHRVRCQILRRERPELFEDSVQLSTLRRRLESGCLQRIGFSYARPNCKSLRRRELVCSPRLTRSARGSKSGLAFGFWSSQSNVLAV